MVIIREIHDKKRKATLCGAILRSLPGTFPEGAAIEEHMQRCTGAAFFAAYEDQHPVGFLALMRRTPSAAEVGLACLRKQYQRQGIGGRLLCSAEEYCVPRGIRLLSAKLPDPMTREDPLYGVRAFLSGAGFLPLEVLPRMWPPDRHCLVLVKAVEGHSPLSSPRGAVDDK